MRIAVVGCGAMGSIYAALLATSGHEVLCIDRNAHHIDAIRRGGLRVSGASGDRTVRIAAFTEAPQERVDLVILAMKAAHVGTAADAVHMLGEEGVVLTIQNGLGSADVAARVFGEDRLIVGVAQGFGASLPAPGHSHHNDQKVIRMGPHAAVDLARIAEVAAAFQGAGLAAEAVEDVAAIQWEKLICNVAYSGPCALTGMTVGEVRDDPIVGPLSLSAATEAFEVAKLRGIPVAVEDPVALVREFAARMPTAKPSVLLDVEAGRASEIGVINGAVDAEARKVGTTAPVNATITGLVLALEARIAKDRSGG